MHSAPRTRSAPAHERLAFERLERAHQHRLGHLGRLAHDVHAVVHAVDEVDVGVAGRAPHHLVPWRAVPARAVRGAVGGATVGLDLDDAARGQARPGLVDEYLPEQRAGDAEGRLEVEGPRELAHADLSFFTSSVSSGTALKRSATSP